MLNDSKIGIFPGNRTYVHRETENPYLTHRHELIRRTSSQGLLVISTSRVLAILKKSGKVDMNQHQQLLIAAPLMSNPTGWWKISYTAECL